MMKTLSKTLFGLLMLVLAACGSNTGSGSAPTDGSAFSLDVTGAVSTQLQAGDAVQAHLATDTKTIPSVTTYILTFTGPDTSFSLLFYGTNALAVGTFNIVSGLTPDKGQVTAMLVNKTGQLESFTSQSGTVTLTQVGDSLSGSVEVTLTGGLAGADQNNTVTVKGTFSEIK